MEGIRASTSFGRAEVFLPPAETSETWRRLLPLQAGMPGGGCQPVLAAGQVASTQEPSRRVRPLPMRLRRFKQRDGAQQVGVRVRHGPGSGIGEGCAAAAGST